MSGKRLKKVDEADVSEKLKENLRLDKSISFEKKKTKEKFTEDMVLNCSADGAKCFGICRDKYTKDGILLCGYAFIPEPSKKKKALKRSKREYDADRY